MDAMWLVIGDYVYLSITMNYNNKYEKAIRFYQKFIFKILYLRPSTPSCMVYGKVGKLPLQVTIDKRLMSFWLRLLNLNKEVSSLAHIVCMIAHNLFVRNVYKAKWLCRVKILLITVV